MWVQLLLNYILTTLLFPRYIGSCIWIIVGAVLFADGYSSIKLANEVESQLTETICKVTSVNDVQTSNGAGCKCYTMIGNANCACAPTNCVNINVSYQVGSQTYSGSAYKIPPKEKCLNNMPFVVNSDYYCWYRTDNPPVVYLSKINTHQSRGFEIYGGLLVLLGSLRILQLISCKLVRARKVSYSTWMPPEAPKPVEILKADSGIPNIFALVLQMILGMFLFSITIGLIAIILTSIYSLDTLLRGEPYIEQTCTVLDAKYENRAAKLKVSYPYKSLTYTTWSRVAVDKSIASDQALQAAFPVNSTLTCYYQDTAPLGVSFDSRERVTWLSFIISFIFTLIYMIPVLMLLFLLMNFDKIKRSNWFSS